MPTFYNYTENGVAYSFDDVFVPADAFRQGNLWAWGSSLRLGNNTGVDRSIPVTTFSGGANWRQIDSGSWISMGIKTDGTLWTWGGNTRCAVGDNTTISRSIPVTTFAGGNNWKQSDNGFAILGFNHTAAIKTDGTLWCWGYNIYGAVGNNLIVNAVSTPVTTFAGGANWKQVSCGAHTAAVKTDGTLWLWGRNSYGGQPRGCLGNNNALTDASTPITTFAGGTNWKQVSCGYFHTAAIKTDGTLWTWGYNVLGQLGDNTTTDRCTPVTTFAGGTNWKQVSCGANHTAAIKTDGTLWTWGNNGGGQLGVNDTIAKTTPVTTFAGGTNWKQVSCGEAHIAAIKTDGTLWTWGSNSFGQLGINNIITRCTPVTTFLGRTDWKQVSASNATIAVTYIDDYQ